MGTLLEWIGTLVLLGLLLLLVPAFFMLIVTLQFRMIGQSRTGDREFVPGPRTQPQTHHDESH
ncbi:MAG: hypothetical protein M3281_00010 [Chloroflexota bacterium]|nr:hypothetical protein [Chloroflexota bacterium]